MNESYDIPVDAASWATAPTDVAPTSRDDASVISVATFRSNSDIMGNKLREMAQAHVAHIANMVDEMAVDVDRPAGQVALGT